MKRFLGLSVIVGLLLVTAAAWAESTVDVKGYVETDNRMSIEVGKPSIFNYNENLLGLAFIASPSENVSVKGSFQLVTIGVDERLPEDRMVEINQEQDRTVTDPVRLQVDEAWMAVKGLGLSNLDVKVGKQRIAWGTGDQFNPTDTLNPSDFHDPLRFGKKVPSPAVRLDYFLGGMTITAAVLPLFYPALLPKTDIRPIFEKQFETMSSQFEIDTGNPVLDTIFEGLMVPAIQGARLGTVRVRSQLPDRSASNANAAVRVGGKLLGVDMSASYAYTRSDFGVPRRITMSVVPFETGTKLIDKVNLDVVQKFPRIHVAGADFTSNVPWLDIGFWGEAAVYFPERFKTEYYLDAGSMNEVLSSLTNRKLDKGLIIAEDDPLKDPYLKAVTGFDYTFPGAWYLNAQFIRGLPTDNTADLQANYAFGGVDKPFFHDVIKARVFGGVCFDDKSWVFYPQVFIYPMDSVEFHVGTFLVFGDVNTKFGAFGDDIAFMRA